MLDQLTEKQREFHETFMTNCLPLLYRQNVNLPRNSDIFVHTLATLGVPFESCKAASYSVPDNEERFEFARKVELTVKSIVKAAGYVIINDTLNSLVVYSRQEDHQISYILLVPTSDAVSVWVYGPPTILQAMKGLLKDVFAYRAKQQVMHLELNKHNQLCGSLVDMPLRSTEQFALTYPYFDFNLAHFAQDFFSSQAPVLILLGPPGSGKSSFIRSLLTHLKNDKDKANVCIADMEQVITNPGLINYVRDDILDAGGALVIEDADQLLAKRSSGNPLMSGLLNATSGIMSTRIKMIITTNLPTVRDIDEALLRPGRTHKVLTFQDLTLDQAHTLRHAKGLPTVTFPNGVKSVSLATALFYDNSDDHASRLAQRTGF